MAVSIRRSTREDARAISTIRIEAWRAAYRGLIDEVLLDRMDVEAETERRTTHWDEHHADPRSAEFIAEVDAQPVGWAVAGPALEPDAVRSGQLYAIYALPAHWSTGVGHALMDAVEHALRDAGFARAHLWVLDGNARAAAFYERHGWVETGEVKLDDHLAGDSGAAPLRERERVKRLRVG